MLTAHPAHLPGSIRLAELDRLVADGMYASRAEAIRAAVADLLGRLERERVDRQLIDGYRRQPQGPADDLADWVGASASELPSTGG